MSTPPEYLDLAQWPRRAAFEHFRGFEAPFFSVCTRVDVAPLRAALARAAPSTGSAVGGLALAYHHIALRLANEHAPFRWRLEGEQVRVHPAVNGSTPVLRDDESFAFAVLPQGLGYAAFSQQAGAALAAARTHSAPFNARVDDSALIHFTTLPWVHFSSFSHARHGGRPDSIPKIAFGRIDAEGARQWLPVAVDVHHALMDGLHLGRWVQAFEAALAEPGPWLTD